MNKRPTPETEIHSCHDQCQKPMCVLRRERDEAREQNAKLLSIAERAIDDLRWFYESKADGIILELNKIKEGAK